MEEVGAPPLGPFNGPLETGIRSLVILDAAYPRSFDLSALVLLDHLVVHTNDIGGPPSLHPSLPHRSGELLVRRVLIEEGLGLMRRKHLIVLVFSSEGVAYKASEEASSIVDLMMSPYAKNLRARALWLTPYCAHMTDAQLRELTGRKLDRWKVELHFPDQPGTEI